MYGRKMNVCLVDGTVMPTYAHDGDAGFDLCIIEDVRLEPNASAVCGLGFACEIPSGCPCDLVGVDSLTDTDRGTDGFGSTGID